MSTHPQAPPRHPRIPTHALGTAELTAGALLLAGVLQLITAVTVLTGLGDFGVRHGPRFDTDLSAWGWVLLALGGAAVSSCLGVLGGWGAARAAAVVAAACSAWASFYFLPYSPVVAPLVCALNVWVIASIMQPGLRRT